MGYGQGKQRSVQAVAENGRTSTIEAWLNRRRACARVMHNKLSISCISALVTLQQLLFLTMKVVCTSHVGSGRLSEVGLIFCVLLNLSCICVRKTIFSGAHSAASPRRNHCLYLRKGEWVECWACLLMSSGVSYRTAPTVVIIVIILVVLLTVAGSPLSRGLTNCVCALSVDCCFSFLAMGEQMFLHFFETTFRPFPGACTHTLSAQVLKKHATRDYPYSSRVPCFRRG